jgi:hypothetical protein
MSIRLDPRRLGALKHLAGEAGVRPGDLVRQWVEERIDAQRVGPAGLSLEDRVAALEERIAALTEEGHGVEETPGRPEPLEPGTPAAQSEPEMQAESGTHAGQVAPADPVAQPDAAPQEPDTKAPRADEAAAVAATVEEPRSPTARRRRVAAAPAERVALHDEMIAVLAERGPLPAGELAAAIAERGRYSPPRSGRSLDAAMVSQRASNPTYRSRFQRREGRIGLAEDR